MKLYEAIAHIYLDISRFFRSAALRVLKQHEEKGDPYASYFAGEIHKFAGGQIHSFSGEKGEAITYFERAAEKGMVEAQYAVGSYYEVSNKTNDIDLAKAIHFLEMAKDSPNLSDRVKKNLRFWYYLPDDLDRHLAYRVDRLKQAINPNCAIYIDTVRADIAKRAASGDAEANHQIGMFRYRGRPHEFGYIEAGGEAAAAPFWEVAAKQGHIGSQLLLAYFGSEDWLRRAAEGGHTGAQRELGHLLYQKAYERWRDEAPNPRERTKPVLTDPFMLKQAMRWWQEAADKGCAESSAYLAAAYEDGYWVEQDLGNAFIWRRKAAAAGWPTGLKLANCYFMGAGTEPNTADALRWYVAAADSGEVDAMLSLGHIYAKGHDVVRDLAEAARWFDRAVEKRRQEITADIRRDYQPEFPSEIYVGMQCSFICRESLNGSEAALQIVNEFYNTYNEHENELSRTISIKMPLINSSFYFGKGSDIFKSKLVQWATSGIAAAQVVLGESVFVDGFDKDAISKRLHYLKLAAQQGSTYAMHLLGDMGHNPDDDGGVRPGEDPAAAKWYSRAAEIGDLEAKFKLAYLGEMAIFESRPTNWPDYDSSDFIEDSPEFQRVLGLYRELAELEHPRAQLRLAALLDGSSPAFTRRKTRFKECKTTQGEAAHWLRKSAENGYAIAANKLAQLLDASRKAWMPHSPETIYWYRAAARGNERDACRALSNAYLIGSGVLQDGAEAMYWRRAYDRMSWF